MQPYSRASFRDEFFEMRFFDSLPYSRAL